MLNEENKNKLNSYTLSGVLPIILQHGAVCELVGCTPAENTVFHFRWQYLSWENFFFSNMPYSMQNGQIFSVIYGYGTQSYLGQSLICSKSSAIYYRTKKDFIW